MITTIEIKARCQDQERVRRILRAKKADFKGIDHQVDTYFKVSSGRLKLREGNIENHLIYYEREDKEGPKQSNVILFRTGTDSPLKELLAKALDVLTVVDKQREIYFIGRVKFHIDSVKRLGTFIEIEAIDNDRTIGKKRLHEQCTYFLDLFGIPKKDMVSVSYSDMLLSKP